MPNNYVMQGGRPARGNVSARPPSSYTRANRDRQSRFDARSARRWGDWGILEIPTAMLWLDEACAVLDDEGACLEQAMVDLWP